MWVAEVVAGFCFVAEEAAGLHGIAEVVALGLDKQVAGFHYVAEEVVDFHATAEEVALVPDKQVAEEVVGSHFVAEEVADSHFVAEEVVGCFLPALEPDKQVVEPQRPMAKVAQLEGTCS